MSNDAANAVLALAGLRSELMKKLDEIQRHPPDQHACAIVTIDNAPLCFEVGGDGETLVHLHPTLLDYATLTSRPYADHVCKLVRRHFEAQGVDSAWAGKLAVKTLEEACRYQINKIDAAIMQYRRPDNATVH